MSDDKQESTPQSPRFFWRNIGILFSGIAVSILFGAIIWAGYGLFIANTHTTTALARLTNQFNEAQKNTMNAEQSIQQINEALRAQSQLISDVQKTQRTNKEDFFIAEASYLVRLASDSLQYENNVPLAIRLLQSADQDIAKLADPKTYPVRKAFAADLVALQSVPQLDVAGVYAQLAALNAQIDKLSFMMQLPNIRSDASAQENNPALPWWRRALNSLEQALQRIVVIRKNSPDALPFIAPDQQVFLYQNLHAELEKAQWGLLHHQQDVYYSSLLQAANWIKKYAVQDAQMTQQILQNLDQLQKINVRPNVPNLTASLQALKNFQN